MTTRPSRWPWYGHVLLLLLCIAAPALYTWLRGCHREEVRVELVVLGMLLTVTLALVVRQKHRRLTR